jgi:hypothetical protein
MLRHYRCFPPRAHRPGRPLGAAPRGGADSPDGASVCGAGPRPDPPAEALRRGVPTAALAPTRSGPVRAAATPHTTAKATPAARPAPLHPTRHATAAKDPRRPKEDAEAAPACAPDTPDTTDAILNRPANGLDAARD